MDEVKDQVEAVSAIAKDLKSRLEGSEVLEAIVEGAGELVIEFVEGIFDA